MTAVRWIGAAALAGVAVVAALLLADARRPAAEESQPVMPGLVHEEVVGLRLLSPGALEPVADPPAVDDSTVVRRDDYTASGLGVLLTVSRIRYAPDTAPFLDDAVARAVSTVQSAVARDDGSDAFAYVATRGSVSGRYGIRVRATYNEPVGLVEQWTEAVFLQVGDDLWQVQVVGSSGEGSEPGRASAAILGSVEIVAGP